MKLYTKKLVENWTVNSMDPKNLLREVNYLVSKSLRDARNHVGDMRTDGSDAGNICPPTKPKINSDISIFYFLNV